MDIPFLVAIFIYLVPQVIVITFLNKALYAYTVLYREKKDLDYPIIPTETFKYISKPTDFMKIYLTPVVIWHIIFERHKDKELNAAANKVRFVLFSYFLVLIIELIILVSHILA